MNSIVDTTPFYKKLAYNLVNFSIICIILYLGQGILKPLFFSILLSVLLLPIIKFLRRKYFNKVFSILITLIITFLIALAVIYFLSRQVFNFMHDFDSIVIRLNEIYLTLQNWVKNVFGITITHQDEYMISTGQKLDTAKIMGRTFVSLTSVLSYLIFLPIFSFLILYYKDHIKRFLIAALYKSSEAKIKDILKESSTISHRYIVGLLTELLIVFALNSTGFLILGIKYALFLALVAALLNLIPYIGIIVANIFCMLITLVFSENIYDVMWVGAILAFVQLIDNNFLVPLIVGSKVKINALVTLLGVLVGGVIWGISGMFLAIPGLAVLKVIFDRVDNLKPYGIMLGDEPSRLPNIPDKIKSIKLPGIKWRP